MSSAHSPASVPPRWLAWGFRLLALGIGALHTLVAVRSQSMNEDGIGYLDLGDAFWQGRWDEVVNTTWSPLYALIVGGPVNLLQPSVWWEFPTVQITNFVVYAFTLVCFERFWRQLSITYYAGSPAEGEVVRIPPGVWTAIGYSLFIYVSLNLVALWAVTPDMLVSAVVYLAAAQLLKLGRAGAGLSPALGLGLALGIGYLAKAAMFPLGLVLIVLATLLPAAGTTRPARLVGALSVFLLLVAPWAAVVSSAAGHLTFSDVGRFTYLKHVNGMPWPQWQQAAEPVAGKALHPPRQVHAEPPVWEFANPIGGTYPLAYDPAWWTQGLEPQLRIAEQVQTIVANGVYYFDLFVRMQGGMLAIAGLLLALSLASRWRPVRFDGTHALLLWALAALGMYLLVFAETRYVAPFVLLLWAALLAQVRLPARESAARTATLGGALFALFAWVNIAAMNLEGLVGQLGISTERQTGAMERVSQRRLSGGHKARHPQIAAALQAMGLEKGTPVAFIGYSYSAYWSRLARLRIVAEIRPEDADAFWNANEEGRREALAALARAGAVAVVADAEGIGSVPDGFARIPGNSYLVRWLH